MSTFTCTMDVKPVIACVASNKIFCYLIVILTCFILPSILITVTVLPSLCSTSLNSYSSSSTVVVSPGDTKSNNSQSSDEQFMHKLAEHSYRKKLNIWKIILCETNKLVT